MAQDNFNISKFLKESVKNSYTNQVAGEEKKELLNENFVGLEPINTIPPRNKEDYELAFDKYLGEEKFKVGDKVTMKGGSDEMEVTDSRRMFGSKINAYSVKKSDGEEVEYDESQLKLAEISFGAAGVDNKVDHSNHGIDDEGRMAKSQLYKIAKYASELYKMMDDNTQLDAWVQAKLTKACDYVGTVKHYLEGEEAIDMLGEEKDDEHKG